MERTLADFYDEDDVLRFLRHKRRRISESDRRWLDRAREIVDAAAVYRETHQRRPWRSTDTGGCWGDTVLPYRSLGRLFADCDEVIVCGCTIGQDVYRTIREWMATDPAFGVVVDATASVLVDAYAAYLQHTFGATTMRFSPGYGDVPLALNQELATCLQLSKRIGVHVTDGHLMVPEKSIIFLTGCTRKEEPHDSI